MDHIFRKPFAQLVTDHLEINRFCNKSVHACICKLLLCVYHSICSQGNDWQVLVLWFRKCPDCFGSFNAVHHRHHVIHQYQIIMPFLYHSDSIFSIFCGINLKLQRFQKLLGNEQVQGIIIYQENVGILCGKQAFCFFADNTVVPLLVVDF